MTPISDLEICRAYPIDEIPARTRAGAAIIHMILNNLDSRVAQFPEELVTYGGNGQVLWDLSHGVMESVLAPGHISC